MREGYNPKLMKYFLLLLVIIGFAGITLMMQQAFAEDSEGFQKGTLSYYPYGEKHYQYNYPFGTLAEDSFSRCHFTASFVLESDSLAGIVTYKFPKDMVWPGGHDNSTFYVVRSPSYNAEHRFEQLESANTGEYRVLEFGLVPGLNTFVANSTAFWDSKTSQTVKCANPLDFQKKEYEYYDHVFSPRVQQNYAKALGLDEKGILCKPELTPILKHDGTAVCVSTDTKEKIIKRGWMLTEDSQTKLISSPSPEYNDVIVNEEIENKTHLQVTPKIIDGKKYLVFEGSGWHGLHNVEITIFKDDEKITSIRSKTNENGILYTPWPLQESLPSGPYMIRASDGINKKEISISHPIMNQNVIPISTGLEVKVTGEKQVRRGVTHNIDVQVNRDDTPVDGALVFIRIEDYGEDIIREFKGHTDQRGHFVFSWEIPKKFDDIETLLAFVDVTDGISSKTVLFKFYVYCLPGEKGCKVEGN